MFKDLAFEIFVADGGVDDFRTLSDDVLRTIVRMALHSMAEDEIAINAIIREARGL